MSMVQAKKGSLATRGSVKVAPPQARAISIPKETKISSSRFNKHKGR
jgi:hypothetical protein